MNDILAQLQKRWSELDAGDRSAIKFGGITISVFLVIGLVIIPTYNSYERLKKQAPNLQAKLEIMQAQAHEAGRLKSNTTSKRTNESLLSVLEKSTTHHDIKSTVQSLTPRADHSAAIRLKSVEYEKLIKWLAGLNSQYQLRASEAELTKKTGPGMVDAYLVFRDTSR